MVTKAINKTRCSECKVEFRMAKGGMQQHLTQKHFYGIKWQDVVDMCRMEADHRQQGYVERTRSVSKAKQIDEDKNDDKDEVKDE